jgi:hypothetical protein
MVKISASVPHDPFALDAKRLSDHAPIVLCFETRAATPKSTRVIQDKIFTNSFFKPLLQNVMAKIPISVLPPQNAVMLTKRFSGLLQRRPETLLPGLILFLWMPGALY